MSARPLGLPAAAARTSAGARVRALPLQADAAALLGVGVIFCALAALTWNSWGDLAGDTGYDWEAATRIAHGSLPYADFTYYYGPLPVMLLGGVFALLGANAGAAIALGLVLAVAAVALTYRVARELTGPVGAAVAAALAATCALATGNNSVVDPHSVSASFAVVLTLAVVLAGIGYARGGRRGWLVAVATGVGLGALTRPETLAALAVAVGAWLLLRVTSARGDARRRALADLGLAAAVALAIPLLAYGAFVAGGVSPSRLVSDNLFPVDELSAGGRSVLKLSAPLTAASFAKLAGALVAYAAGLAVLMGAARAIAHGGRTRTLALGAVAIAALGFLAVLAARPEAVRSHLSPVFAWIPAGAALTAAWLAWRTRSARGTWAAGDQAAFLLAATLAAVAARNYAAFHLQPNPRFAQAALYALPLAGIFLVWLQGRALASDRAARALGTFAVALVALACVVLLARDGGDEPYAIHGPGGTITAPATQGQAYQAAVDGILGRTRPGEPVLLAPQMTSLYTITGRRDPLPEISLLPGALATAAAQDAAIRRMDDVRVAVTDRRALTEYGQGAFGSTYDGRIGAWIRANFRHVATLEGAGDGAVTLDLWQRSAP